MGSSSLAPQPAAMQAVIEINNKKTKKHKRDLVNRHSIKIGMLAAGLVILLSGCVQMPSKPDNRIDYAKFSQQDAPLATELGEQEEYEFALDLARLQVERQRYDQAETLLQKLRRTRADDIRLYRLLGQVYEGQGKPDRALIAWQETKALSGRTVDDEAQLARLALMNEQFAEAETIYQAWLKSTERTQQVSALNNLGFSALLQRQYTQAQTYFEQALTKDPLNNKALNNLKLLKTLQPN
jgi:Flp pilus assembly protein TadD